jgi:hypothetical protein
MIYFVLFQVISVILIFIAYFFKLITLDQTIAPAAVIFSTLGAIFVGKKTLENNNRIHILKTTVDKVETDYPIRNEFYAHAVMKIAECLEKHNKTGDELSFDELNEAVELLTKDEHSKLKELVNFYGDICRGMQLGLYDKEMVEATLSGSHVSVWLECWPFIKWHQINDSRMLKTYDIQGISSITPMYHFYEKAIQDALGKRNIYPMPSKSRIIHTYELIKNTA